MRNSIRTRLTVAFIGLAIAPVLLIGGILAWQSFTTQERQVLNLQGEVARRVAAEVTAFFEELENELRLFSKTYMLPGLDWNEQYRILELLMLQDVFEGLILLDSQGQEKIYLSRLGLSSTGWSQHVEANKFVIPHMSGEVYYGPIRFDETTSEPLMIIALPLLDVRTGLVDGVLISDVRLKKIWNVIADIRVDPGQSVYIVDTQDRVVAHRNPSVVLRGTSFDVPDQDGIQPGLTGSSVVLAVNTVRFGEQEFNIIAEQTVSEALALAINSMYVIATIIVVALVVASSLGFLTVRQIVHPIQAMATTAQAISAGDLSQQVQFASQDELGILANTFNSMTAQLRTLIDNLEQRVAERTAQLEAVQVELLRQERLATLGKLTATVSHEIRNPLGTIRASIFAVDRKTRDKGLGIERALERIERNITRCDDIIGELLDYTRMSEPNLRSVMFDEWLRQFLDEHTLPRDVQLVREFAAEIKILLDPTRFQRVLINLLDNACQAMLEYVHPGVDQSAIILRIQTAVVDGRVQLSISDTGPGIPPDVLPHIFVPLYSTKGFGVGLGLPIVKEIIQQHNGDIKITSEVGQGTQVILWLPVLREERET
jgi:signal transduction histidine kinase